MPKLHELLAVDGNLKAQATKVRTELTQTFEKKTHLFTEKTDSFKPLEEGAVAVVEKQLDLQTTVPRELKWISEFLIKSIDVSYEVAEANTVARADVVLDDGKTLLSQIPVTCLLELEKRAGELRALVVAIPTLDPAKGFRLDPDKAADVYRAREDKRERTKKVTEPVVLHPGTEKHAPQVQLLEKVVPTGEITTLEWSGLMTTADKGDMLSRVEMLTRAIKQARSRANDVDVPKTASKIGADIVKYVFGQ